MRPLYDERASEAHEATRDYVLRLDGTAQSGALINIFGGKITTYRQLAEAVMDKVEGVLGARKPAWTSGATLPGGDFSVDGFETLVADLAAGAPNVPESTIRRLARNYGTRTTQILQPGGTLGRIFGADLGESEVRYLIDNEWARSAEDILWRRSKLGLRFSASETDALSAYMETCNVGREGAVRNGQLN